MFLIVVLTSFLGASMIYATENSTNLNDRITEVSETKDEPIAGASTQEQESSVSHEDDEAVLAQKISLISPVSEFQVGKTTQLSVVIQPNNTTDQTYTPTNL